MQFWEAYALIGLIVALLLMTTWLCYWIYFVKKVRKREKHVGLWPEEKKSQRKTRAVLWILVSLLLFLPLVSLGLGALPFLPYVWYKNAINTFLLVGLPCYVVVFFVAFFVTPLGKHLRGEIGGLP